QEKKERKQQQQRQQSQPALRRTPLLVKLLEPEVNREKDVILTILHYIHSNNFFLFEPAVAPTSTVKPQIQPSSPDPVPSSGSTTQEPADSTSEVPPQSQS